jgi:two-component system response regulator RegA
MKNPEQGHYVLVVEEDTNFLHGITEQLKLHGYSILTASDGEEAASLASRYKPRHCVLGLAMRGENRLLLIPALQAIVPQIRIVVATQYGSVATAVAAMKRGASDYFAKPFKVCDLAASLRGAPAYETAQASATDQAEVHLALRRVEWEYIQRVLIDCEGNISETAKRLHVHRRTLQRKLSKRPVAERPGAIH